MSELLLDYKAVAERLAVSVRTVRRLRAQRILTAIAIGHRTVRFRPADVERAKAKLAGQEVREW